MEQNHREPGYYWVKGKTIDRWIILQWNGMSFEDTIGCLQDDWITAINETRIPSPDEVKLSHVGKTYRQDIENIQVGDIAFDECINSMGTGGYTYDSGEKVIAITDSEIITLHPYDNKVKYYDKTKHNAVKTEQTAYYLHGFYRD